MEFAKYKIEEFINELSEDSPSPGGGSTAALVAALASSLNSMVYSFTIDKKSYEQLDSEKKVQMLRFGEEGKAFTQIALNFMERDREEFTALMDSFKLPKSNEEELNYRKKTIKEKTIKAMNTPLELAKAGYKIYDNILFAVKYGNNNLISDGIVAAILLHSAIEAAIVNVIVNYNGIKSDAEFDEIPKICKQIISESLKKKNEICSEFIK